MIDIISKWESTGLLKDTHDKEALSMLLDRMQNVVMNNYNYGFLKYDMSNNHKKFVTFIFAAVVKVFNLKPQKMLDMSSFYNDCYYFYNNNVRSYTSKYGDDDEMVLMDDYVDKIMKALNPASRNDDMIGKWD